MKEEADEINRQYNERGKSLSRVVEFSKFLREGFLNIIELLTLQLSL